MGGLRGSGSSHEYPAALRVLPRGDVRHLRDAVGRRARRPSCDGGAGVAEATAQGDACAAILTADLGLPHTTITVAEEVTPPFTPPETFSSRGFTVEDASFCRVAGVASPEAGSEIGFEVWLPPVGDWNGRFQGIGSGGSAGAIRYRQLASAVAGGYAAVATDNGHTSTSGFRRELVAGAPGAVGRLRLPRAARGDRRRPRRSPAPITAATPTSPTSSAARRAGITP